MPFKKKVVAAPVQGVPAPAAPAPAPVAPTVPVAAPAPAPAKPKPAGKAFGGYAVSFRGRKETLEQLFGPDPVQPGEMTKKLWAFVKANKLSTKI